MVPAVKRRRSVLGLQSQLPHRQGTVQVEIDTGEVSGGRDPVTEVIGDVRQRSAAIPAQGGIGPRGRRHVYGAQLGDDPRKIERQAC